ncbi:hypothetical protein CY35_13G076200 [Sphagnum magellanicum]|nr:hypothetical protein CY35_13G076200 [Sphagnum magellanicum]
MESEAYKTCEGWATGEGDAAFPTNATRMSPDKFTFVPLIKACAGLGRLEDGRLVHKQLIQSGYKSDVFVCKSLVDMYAKYGSIEEAWTVFERMPSQNVVTWTTIILGHVQCQRWQKALELFGKMQQEGVQPDSVTFVGVLNACASILTLEEGRCVHQQTVEFVCDSDVFVGNNLVDMYAKCGSIEDAWRVFNKMPSRNVVTWNAMVLGHVKCGQGQKELGLFQHMQQEGVQPDSVTFVGVLKACTSTVAIEEGRFVHQDIIQSGLESDVFVGSSLVKMYAKCGSMEDAWRVFNKMPSRTVVTWNAILGGCAMNGHACGHAGLVDEGMHCYASMVTDYMISAKLEHYTCMVDLLGHAGHVQEVENMVMATPWKPHVAAWMALLGACRIHGNVEMAERVARRILEMEPDNGADYGLPSNIYAAGGNWHLCENVKC